MKQNSFPYGYWVKILGIAIALFSVILFLVQYYSKAVLDLNDLGVGLSWGFVFIFFSKEKTEDEMIQNLKFKALTWAIIVAFALTHLFNYVFLNWYYERGHSRILSISAYQFLALALIIATANFHYLKQQATSNGRE